MLTNNFCTPTVKDYLSIFACRQGFVQLNKLKKKQMNIKSISNYFILIPCFLILNSTIALSQNYYELMRGNWIGNIEFQGKKIPLQIRVNYIDKDSVFAFMDSPDQGARDIVINKFILRNDSALIRVKALGVSISGLINSADTSISGVFRQSIFNCPIILKKTYKVNEMLRPQNPKPPFNYKVVDVSFKNYADNIELSGTLTIPEGNKRFPVVVLVSGSGPQNRDEEILGHKPFWVIADFLSRNGVAVLRYDDRGIAKSKGDFNAATSFNFSYDAEAAVKYLMELSDIDTNNIGIIGHSEGGMIAPMIAARNSKIKFVVLMAGPGLTGEEILMKQSVLISEAEGESKDEIKKNSNLNKKIYNIVNNEIDNTIAAKKIRKVFDKSVKKLSKDEKKQAEGQKDIIINQVTSNWFRYFLKFNPKDYLTKTHCAVLAINGGKDLQVPPDENLKAIEKYLKIAGNKNFTIRKFDNLNHLFQNCNTGSPSEYVKIEETISPEVLSFMHKWISDIVK